jgi:arginase
MARRIEILEFPSNLGLISPGGGREPGVKKLPAWLRHFGFHERISPDQTILLLPPVYTCDIDSESGVRNADAIATYAVEQAEQLKDSLNRGSFVIAIGGDCSILIGNAFGLKQLGSYAVFFLDGHTDFMPPSLSETHGAAGMDLAIITGHGHIKLTDIGGLSPYVREEHVFAVGNRDLEENYTAEIKRSGICYVDLFTLRSTGCERCASDFLAMVSEGKLDGFWIHLDVDVLDDSIMPCVDSRQPGGLSFPELHSLLTILLHHPQCAGIEITILDPELDPEGKYTLDFIDQFIVLVRQSGIIT